MHIDDGFAALKFFDDRFQDGVSEVHAVGIRKENKTIEPEDVECVRELLRGGIDIRRQGGGRRSLQTGPVVNEPVRPRIRCSGTPKPALWRYLPCARRA
jgi:hypothetical protein